MSLYATYCGAWDFADFGSCTYTLTDSAGAHAPFVFSSGQYEHDDMIVRAGVLSPGLNSFATAFRNALNAASPTRSYTVTWSPSTGRYTITVNTGTFSIACSGGTRAASAALLGGVTVLASTGTSYTSEYLPWTVIVPRSPGLARYVQPMRASEAVKQRISAGGTPYRMKPTLVPRLASWQHVYEPKYMVDRDAYGSTGETLTHLYTWEDLWTDYQLAKLPIGIEVSTSTGSYETMAFSLDNPDYDESVIKRRAPNDDGRFSVSVRARLWLGNTSSGLARTFNA